MENLFEQHEFVCFLMKYTNCSTLINLSCVNKFCFYQASKILKKFHRLYLYDALLNQNKKVSLKPKKLLKKTFFIDDLAFKLRVGTFLRFDSSSIWGCQIESLSGSKRFFDFPGVTCCFKLQTSQTVIVPKSFCLKNKDAIYFTVEFGCSLTKRRVWVLIDLNHLHQIEIKVLFDYTNNLNSQKTWLTFFHPILKKSKNNLNQEILHHALPSSMQFPNNYKILNCTKTTTNKNQYDCDNAKIVIFNGSKRTDEISFHSWYNNSIFIGFDKLFVSWTSQCIGVYELPKMNIIFWTQAQVHHHYYSHVTLIASHLLLFVEYNWASYENNGRLYNDYFIRLVNLKKISSLTLKTFSCPSDFAFRDHRLIHDFDPCNNILLTWTTNGMKVVDRFCIDEKYF